MIEEFCQWVYDTPLAETIRSSELAFPWLESVHVLAIALVLEHGFQRVELRVAPGNLACRRVAEKAGFHYEGLLRNAGFVHSGRVGVPVHGDAVAAPAAEQLVHR